MNGVTWNKAGAAALVAPLADWLVKLADGQLISHFGVDIPTSVEVALSSLILGLVVWAIPNAEKK